MVQRSVIQRERNPGYEGVMTPVIARSFGQSPFCGSQSVGSASFVSNTTPVSCNPTHPSCVSFFSRISLYLETCTI